MAQLFREVEAGDVRENADVVQLAHVEDVHRHIRKLFGFGLDDGQVFRLLLLGQVSLLKQFGKAGDGDDGCLELVGKVVDEVVSQDFVTAQLLCEFIEALFQFPEGTEPAQYCRDLDTGIELSLRQAVDHVDILLQEAQRHTHDAGGKPGPDEDGEQRHDDTGPAGRGHREVRDLLQDLQFVQEDRASDDDDGGGQQNDGDDGGKQGGQLGIPFPVFDGLRVRTRQFVENVITAFAHGSPLLFYWLVVAL